MKKAMKPLLGLVFFVLMLQGAIAQDRITQDEAMKIADEELIRKGEGNMPVVMHDHIITSDVGWLFTSTTRNKSVCLGCYRYVFVTLDGVPSAQMRDPFRDKAFRAQIQQEIQQRDGDRAYQTLTAQMNAPEQSYKVVCLRNEAVRCATGWVFPCMTERYRETKEIRENVPGLGYAVIRDNGTIESYGSLLSVEGIIKIENRKNNKN